MDDMNSCQPEVPARVSLGGSPDGPRTAHGAEGAEP